MMPAGAVGELVTAPFEFVCAPRGHRGVEEVRIGAIRERPDRRFTEGVRVDISWRGYCARCGRRVDVEPRRDAVSA